MKQFIEESDHVPTEDDCKHLLYTHYKHEKLINYRFPSNTCFNNYVIGSYQIYYTMMLTKHKYCTLKFENFTLITYLYDIGFQKMTKVEQVLKNKEIMIQNPYFETDLHNLESICTRLYRNFKLNKTENLCFDHMITDQYAPYFSLISCLNTNFTINIKPVFEDNIKENIDGVKPFSNYEKTILTRDPCKLKDQRF